MLSFRYLKKKVLLFIFLLKLYFYQISILFLNLSSWSGYINLIYIFLFVFEI